MEKIRILVADDHPVVREGLARLLEGEEGLECIGTARDGDEAVDIATKLQPDVVLIDIAMAGMDGIEATKRIKSACPSTAVIALSAYDYKHYVAAAIRAGASGYLLKNIARSKLVEIVRMAHSGRDIFVLEGSAQMIRTLGNIGVKPGAFDQLHDREIEIVRQVASGMSNKRIANRLGISENTVASHLSNVFRKLGVQSRGEAIVLAIKEGLVTVDDLAPRGDED